MDDFPDTNESTRKTPLESLSKEELLEKYRNVLTFAKKAKSVKDAVQSENTFLLTKLAASDEVIAAQTEQKLKHVQILDELRKEKQGLVRNLQVATGRIEELENDKQALCRQIDRQTDENNELLSTLDNFEKEIEQLKNIGLEQQRDLLQLESIGELQATIRSSELEIGNLKSANESLQQELHQYQGEVFVLENKLKMQTDENVKETAHQNNHSDSDGAIKNTETVPYNDYTSLLNENDQLRQKVILYHTKIKKFAGIVRQLRESKEGVLSLFKQHNSNVCDWRTRLELIARFLQTEEKRFNEIKERSSSLERLNEKQCNEIEELTARNENLKSELKLQNELYNKVIAEKDQISQVSNEDISNLREKLNSDLKAEKEAANIQLHDLSTRCQRYDEKFIENETEIMNLREKYELQCQYVDRLESCDNKNSQTSSLKETEIIELTGKLNNLQMQLAEYENTVSEHQEKLSSSTSSIQILESEIAKLTDSYQAVLDEKNNLEKLRNSNLELNQKSSDEIIRLSTENDALQAQIAEFKSMASEHRKCTDKINKLNSDLDCTMKENMSTEQRLLEVRNEHDMMNEQLAALKRETAELLNEMNVMNQELKERGETISKQQSDYEELRKAYNNKLEQCETSKAEVEQQEMHRDLRNVSTLSEDYAESESMSVSTISKADELGRLRDLEGSWEERYGKLRNLALKLKAKVREQTNELAEKTEMQQKSLSSLKMVQKLQEQNDRAQDDLECARRDLEKLSKKLEMAVTESNRDKAALVRSEEMVAKLEVELDQLSDEKSKTDQWKKQVGAKVSTLKRELEANTITKKDYEQQIADLNAKLELREKQLRDETAKHTQTKNSLLESANECKKQSVRNLEIDDYEKSVRELNLRLERKTESNAQLAEQVQVLTRNNDALREQVRVTEERIEALEREIEASKLQVAEYRKRISELDTTLTERDVKYADALHALEMGRRENEELNTDLSRSVVGQQKSQSQWREERDALQMKISTLEQNLREQTESLRLSTAELESMRTEYDGYKVRAQSVLRQNQSRDIGTEEKREQQLESLRVQLQISQGECETKTLSLKEMVETNELLLSEMKMAKEQLVDLERNVEENKGAHASILLKYEKTVGEHSESIRTLKTQSEALAQCYRQKLADQESRHNREIIELQSLSHLDQRNANVPTSAAVGNNILDTSSTSLTVREEGEGSESVDSIKMGTLTLQQHPLEQLLGGADVEIEVSALKKQLMDHESRVSHLAALLADTEQDLAKHIQMNLMLKEEIRRQQRSIEREEHAENLEYMKNVVVKFITLSNGDERLRLVPVLNTILKLSPDETHKLNAVAKGDRSGWTNYLPAWPNKS